MLTQEELDKLLEEGVDGDKPSTENASSQASAQAGPSGSQKTEELNWEDAFAEAAAGGDAAAAKQVAEGTASPEAARPAQAPQAPPAAAPRFDEFQKTAPVKGEEGAAKPDMDFILDIPLQVSVELGRSKLQIRDLLQLSQGSVVELNKMAGEPAEIYVNQKLMAKGEIVVVNEKFGVRLTEIISPADRVKNLA